MEHAKECKGEKITGEDKKKIKKITLRCPFCSRGFILERSLKMHKAHCGLTRDRACPYDTCTYQYWSTRQDLLKRHIKKSHKEDHPPPPRNDQKEDATQSDAKQTDGLGAPPIVNAHQKRRPLDATLPMMVFRVMVLQVRPPLRLILALVVLEAKL